MLEWRKIQVSRRIKTCVLLCTCLLLLVFLSEQGVVFAQTKVDTVQTDQSAPNKLNFFWNEKNVNILLGLLGLVTGSVSLYKFYLSPKYSIESLQINLVHKAPIQDIGYTEFVCANISKDNMSVEQNDWINPYYLEVNIKIPIPNEHRALQAIIINRLIINIGEFEIKCLPKKEKKCAYDKLNNTCTVLIKWPAFKEIEYRRLLNPIEKFLDPEGNKIILHISWYPRITILSVFGILFPEKEAIIFEKKKYEKGSSIISIVSKKILKERNLKGRYNE